EGFKFANHGVRVPALIISPLIPKGVVDHTTYDHASAVRSVGRKLGFSNLCERDRFASDFSHLFTLDTPRKTVSLAKVSCYDPENQLDQGPSLASTIES